MVGKTRGVTYDPEQIGQPLYGLLPAGRIRKQQEHQAFLSLSGACIVDIQLSSEPSRVNWDKIRTISDVRSAIDSLPSDTANLLLTQQGPTDKKQLERILKLWEAYWTKCKLPALKVSPEKRKVKETLIHRLEGDIIRQLVGRQSPSGGLGTSGSNFVRLREKTIIYVLDPAKDKETYILFRSKDVDVVPLVTVSNHNLICLFKEPPGLELKLADLTSVPDEEVLSWLEPAK